MSDFGGNRREARLNANYAGVAFLSDSMYNLVIGGVVFYGLLVNFLLCTFCTDFARDINYTVFLIAYFVCCFAGIALSVSSKNPVVSFLGYNLVVVPVGLVVSMAVEQYGGVDAQVVQLAFLYTMIITVCMIMLSIVRPKFFAGIGGVLFSALCGIIVCEIICLLLGVGQIMISWISAVVFSLYIGYDFWRSQQFAKTLDNAVDCALDIYLDIVNLFLSVLEILGKKKD